ncbi:MAG: hypothetical protein WBC44_20260 [Planctomycetaceae bacterium]
MKIHRFAVVGGFVMLCAALVSATPADNQVWERPNDPTLEQALKGDAPLMFGEHVTSKTGSGADLVITSARSVQGKPIKVRMRSGTTTIFRADAAPDDFTKQGGWYWRCGDAEGKAQFEKSSGLSNAPAGAGALIRVVYQHDGTVHWYSLQYDLRC